ncbi:M48 family metallopeptidase [Streptomyces sp. B21-083]|uniref:M48 family metallopeptidase n=1 Tax=Streptomyces sp. B21-083 TaxID=3039410 RepID=UPI002FF26C29
MRRTKLRSTTSRALLGCALLAGVHLLAVAVLAVQLLLLIILLTARSWHLALLGNLTLVPVSTLAYGLLGKASAGVTEGPRIELTPQGQPDLWTMTRRLAGELDTAVPATICLTDTVNACARERAKLLGLIGGPRTLDLGLPLLLGLGEDELRAVLCHELGHYAGRHTRLAAVSHRGSVALERAVRYMEFLESDRTSAKPPVRLLLKLTRAYNDAYLRQTLAVRRSQELEADSAAARIAGAHTFAQALRTVHALTPLWADLTENPDRSTAPAGECGLASPPALTLPEGVFRTFASRIADLAAHAPTGGQGSLAPSVVSEDGLGSHPPLAVRLAALCPDDDPNSAYRPTLITRAPAAGLLRDLPELVEDLQDSMRPASAAVSTQADATMSVKPPEFNRALLRFLIKTNLIGMSLVVVASLFVHTVIYPPRADPTPSPLPSAQTIWPLGSPPPLISPTFTFPPHPSPSLISTPILVPLR